MENLNETFATPPDGLAKVNRGRFAMIMDRINLEYYEAKNCSYMLLGEALTQVRRWLRHAVLPVKVKNDSFFHAKADEEKRSSKNQIFD